MSRLNFYLNKLLFHQFTKVVSYGIYRVIVIRICCFGNFITIIFKYNT